MKFVFENEIGKIIFGDDSPFKITHINGLYTPSKNYGTISYADYDGTFTYSDNANARIITIGGDVVSKDLRYHLEEASRIFNRSGFFTVDCGEKVRKIECNQVNFSVSSRTMISCVFTLQFLCDYPYFTDENAEKCDIHGFFPLIKNPVTFPCVLSQSNNKKDIDIKSHIKTYPVFTIIVESKGSVTNEENYGYKLINHTTGRSIYLKHKSVAGEKIYIDVLKREVKSSVSGNILAKLSDYDDIENFYLAPGINKIEAVDLGEGDKARISMEYKNYYVEAVY